VKGSLPDGTAATLPEDGCGGAFVFNAAQVVCEKPGYPISSPSPDFTG